MINVELTNEDAELFKIFRQFQDTFLKMIELGVFEKDNIQVSLYFDKFSSLRAIDKTKRLCVNYKKY